MWSPDIENDISTLAYLDSEHDFGPVPTRSVFSVIQESLPGFIQILDGTAENAALTYATQKTGRVFSNMTLTNPNNTYRSLGGSESTAIALVCDSSFCSNLVAHLAENTIGPVYIVRNREVANDPGTNKSYKHVKHPLYVAEDVDKEDVCYDIFDTSDKYTTKFGASNYNLKLSVNEMHICDISNNICCTREFNKRINANQYSQNVERLHRLADMESPYNIHEPSVKQYIQTSFISKRSGDFLQVLSCMDSSRDYMVNGSLRKLNDVQIYFCSADKVPLAYSLYLNINCIRYLNPTSCSVFRRRDTINMQTQSALMHADFVENNTVKRAESVEILQESLRIRSKFTTELTPYILKVKEATSIADVKQCYTYALQYKKVISEYPITTRSTSIIQEFISNPNSSMFEDPDAQRIINTKIGSWRSVNRKYATFDIHRPITDPNFIEFNPTSYRAKVKSKKESYGVIYAQALLYMLLKPEDPILRDFVIDAVDKITTLANDETISHHYAYFMYTYNLYRHKGGGVGGAGTLPTTYMKHICEHLIRYLQSFTYDASELYFYPTRFGLCDYSICEDIIDRLIVDYGIVLPKYIDYLRDRGQSYWNDTQEEIVTQFLKRQRQSKNQNTRTTRRYKMMAVARKQRRTIRSNKHRI